MPDKVDPAWDTASCNLRLGAIDFPPRPEWEYVAKGGPDWVSLTDNAVYAPGSGSAEMLAWYQAILELPPPGRAKDAKRPWAL